MLLPAACRIFVHTRCIFPAGQRTDAVRNLFAVWCNCYDNVMVLGIYADLLPAPAMGDL
jgi:hypothetical protein